jgi:hypothetical protein
MSGRKKIYVTFDTDFADYIDGSNHIDELDTAFEDIQAVLMRHPEVKTTWFVRIDGQIEEIYGSADFLYNKHIEKINWLRNNGHSIGWHHHSYKRLGEKWVQDINEVLMLEDLKKYGTFAQQKGMAICRMGWGYHTNKTMKLVSEMGFRIDSSAIPRPNYKWDLSVKDWETTTLDWYHPSCLDYRISGEHSLAILEVPMSTTQIPVKTDTEGNVIRYLNPAYYSNYFVEALNKLNNTDKIITITHPYELIANKNTHSLLSFSIAQFEENVAYMKNTGYEFDILK